MKSLLDEEDSATLREIECCHELFKLNRFYKNALVKEDARLAEYIQEKMVNLWSLNLDSEDPIAVCFEILIDGYEEVLSIHHHKVTFATYSRRKISEVGIIQFLKDLMRRDDKTYGLELLRKYDRLDVAYENLLIDTRFQVYFTNEEIAEAKRRLAKAKAS